jgi:hypothetical protein
MNEAEGYMSGRGVYVCGNEGRHQVLSDPRLMRTYVAIEIWTHCILTPISQSLTLNPNPGPVLHNPLTLALHPNP